MVIKLVEKAYIKTISPTPPEWQNGKMVKWQNGRMVKWQNGKMVKW